MLFYLFEKFILFNFTKKFYLFDIFSLLIYILIYICYNKDFP